MNWQKWHRVRGRRGMVRSRTTTLDTIFTRKLGRIRDWRHKGDTLMELMTIIKQLMEERDLIDSAIVSLERIALQRGKRRGRPPAWMTVLEEEAPQPRKRGRPRKVSSER